MSTSCEFKPSTTEEIRRRLKGAEYDTNLCFYAEEGGRVVGYATAQTNGRVSYPWCRKGHEIVAEKLRALCQRQRPTDLSDLAMVFEGQALVLDDSKIRALATRKFSLVRAGNHAFARAGTFHSPPRPHPHPCQVNRGLPISLVRRIVADQ